MNHLSCKYRGAWPHLSRQVHNQSYWSTGARKVPSFFPASPDFAMLQGIKLNLWHYMVMPSKEKHSNR